MQRYNILLSIFWHCLSPPSFLHFYCSCIAKSEGGSTCNFYEGPFCRLDTVLQSNHGIFATHRLQLWEKGKNCESLILHLVGTEIVLKYLRVYSMLCIFKKGNKLLYLVFWPPYSTNQQLSENFQIYSTILQYFAILAS